MARPNGFEPLTPRFVVWCSIQLSYGRMGPLIGDGIREVKSGNGLDSGWISGWQPTGAVRNVRPPAIQPCDLEPTADASGAARLRPARAPP